MDFMFPTSRGRLPVKKFEDKLRTNRSLRLQKDVGMLKANTLESRESCRSIGRSPKQLGIDPDNLLELKCKYPKFFKWQRSFGMDPCILFPTMYNRWSFCSCPNVAGIDPVKSLAPKSNHIKLVKLPIPVGMVPLKWQADAVKLSRATERFPSEFGRVPFKRIIIYPQCSQKFAICQRSKKTNLRG